MAQLLCPCGYSHLLNNARPRCHLDLFFPPPVRAGSGVAD